MEFQKGKGKEMRQYRGLTKEGKWVYGYYTKFAGYSYIIQEADIGKVHAILKTANGPLPLEFIPVLPETVGQSTGLKDKNGKEIYEGDKVKINGKIYVCEFNVTPYGSQFRFWILPHKKWSDGSKREKEIIGNIHQEVKI